MDTANLELTIALTDPDLEDEEKETIVQNLRNQLQDMDEVEATSLVADPNPPQGHKSAGGFLMGLLTLEVSKENLKKLYGFLADRLGNKPIKLKVKTADGRELELEASSKEEFDYAFAKAQEFAQGH